MAVNQLTRKTTALTEAHKGLLRGVSRAMGARRFNGALLDVSAAAALLGVSVRCVRARVSRRLLPFKRFGSRIVFSRIELELFVAGLPGCSLDEAKDNARLRQGVEP